FALGSRTGSVEDTAIHADEPRDVYTLPSSTFLAPSAMHELSTPPQTTFTLVPRPVSSAALGVNVPRTAVEGIMSGSLSADIPLALMYPSWYRFLSRSYTPEPEAYEWSVLMTPVSLRLM